MTVADDLPPFLVLFFAFCFLSGVCESVLITQWPRYISTRSNDSITCSHDDSNLLLMFWYQQRENTNSMTLIGYGYENSPNYEGEFEKQFKLTRQSATKGALTILKANPSHSAYLYIKFSSVLFDIKMKRCANYEAYFGQGTKLTVLEEGINITEPKVEIIQPSKKECRDKNNKRKKTLLCVASDFYPDHVTLSWETIGGEMLGSVATDSAARRNGMFYKLTSRLRVPAHQWFNPGIEFKCTVNFFNGSGTEAFFAVVKCMLLKT
uniref:Ig-like domain-containing protein n=1 Tax=Kryptolebias marmoratus TaxID=37003 RepID=A0A3Q3B0A9_KRYMA